MNTTHNSPNHPHHSHNTTTNNTATSSNNTRHSSGGSSNATTHTSHSNQHPFIESTLPTFEGPVSYEGDMVGNLFHGNGKIVYLNSGVIFRGSFINGLKHGLGVVYYPSRPPGTVNNTDNTDLNNNDNDIVYTQLEAVFDNDTIHGTPTIKHPGGDIYIGPIRNGQMEGYGRYYYHQTNDLYIGMFSHGLRHGSSGIIKFNIHGPPHTLSSQINLNGIDITQVFQQVLAGGQGGGNNTSPDQHHHSPTPPTNPTQQLPTIASLTSKYLTDCEEFFYGEFKEDRFEGRGTYLSKYGFYQGLFKSGLKHGLGTLLFPNGNCFIGEFYQSMKQGHGTLIYARGGEYTGQWLQDLAHGEGTCRYANGEVFQGTFANGRKHGPGVLSLSNGDCLKATWDNDSINGHGKIIYSGSGLIYDGGIVNDSREGLGTLTDATTSTVFSGTFVNNARSGPGRIVFADGSYAEGVWDSGRTVGDLTYHLAPHSIWSNPDL